MVPGIRYDLPHGRGVDGISLFPVLFTTLLMPIAIYFSNSTYYRQPGLYLELNAAARPP